MIRKGHGYVSEDTVTTLFGLQGVRVVEVDAERDGSTTVYVQTAVEVVCPDCATPAVRAKERLACRMRDVPHAGRRVQVVWFKRRWYCLDDNCARTSFTESIAGLPARQRLTTRLREQCATAVAASGRTVAEVADTHAVSWHTAHDAFVETVDPVLADEPGPVRHLGVDEVRRGRPRWEHDPATGQTRQLADRWHTGFTDLSGEQGLLGHVEGRATTDVAGWLDQRSPAWRAGVQTVSIDMCAAFRAAAKAKLPNAVICVDAFHLVQLANKMVTSVRWRIVREKYGRRGRKDDPEYGIKRLLLCNLEDLRDEQLAKLWNTMADDPALADLHVAWIAKEKLRDLLALRITRSHTSPCPSAARNRWAALLSWCADNIHIPEIVTFAHTLDAWRQEIISAVLTGASNAGSEGVNRIQKLDARAAFGYRNPENQRRRARVATLRSARRLHAVTTRQRLWVIGPQHKPG
jgi:transposase